MPGPLRTPRVFPFAPIAALALAAGGCGKEDGVQSYRVPKTTESGKSLTQPDAGEYRILGAIYPADKPVWYFKFAGTAAQVAAYEAEFDKLAQSVKLQATPAALPAFDVPAGWTRTGPRTSTRMGITTKTDETLRFGPPPQLEVTITFIPGGGIPQNIGRWAGQVGLPEFGENDLAKATREFDALGVKGLRVDLRGPKNPAGGMGPMMGRP